MSIIKANKWQRTDGSVVQTPLQVVQTIKTNIFSYNPGTTANNTWIDVTGLSATITPSSANSKILVIADCLCGGVNPWGTHLRLVRGSTGIYVGDARGSTAQASSSAGYDESSSTMSRQTMIFLDSPATTGATTYKVQIMEYNNCTFYLNTGGAMGTSNTESVSGASSITLMEIAG